MDTYVLGGLAPPINIAGKLLPPTSWCYYCSYSTSYYLQ